MVLKAVAAQGFLDEPYLTEHVFVCDSSTFSLFTNCTLNKWKMISYIKENYTFQTRNKVKECIDLCVNTKFDECCPPLPRIFPVVNA